MKQHKQWKRGVALAMLMVMTLSMAACGEPKEAITAKEFQHFMEDKGLQFFDRTDTADSDDYQRVCVAVDEEKYSFEYYFMRNDSTAESLYTFAVEKVKANYKGNSGVVAKEKVLSNTADYSLSASDYYIRVIRVDNTVLYVTAYPDYQDECKGIIKDLGY